MTYNIHPIIVHFPIALLFLYVVVKIIPFSKWFPDVAWKHIERVLLFVGVLGALAAYATGDTAREMVQPDMQLVHTHENFALISIIIFGILLFGECVSLVKQKYGDKFQDKNFILFMNVTEQILCNNIFSKILALAGFVTITLTGMLGGAMVYGLTADPMTGIVLKILGISL